MYYDLFEMYVDKIVSGGSSGQFIGLCPYHEDTKQSFSFNSDKGLFNCKACGVRGNTYKLAKDMGYSNPTEFIDKDYSNNEYQSVKYVKDLVCVADPNHNPKKRPDNYDELSEQFKNNLKKKTFPSIWGNANLIDELGIGLSDNGDWRFIYEYGIKKHKPCGWIGCGTNSWWNNERLDNYDPDKPLHICEGEKDDITLYSNQFQSITQSGGVMSIPRDSEGKYDLLWLDKFKEIYICYDNDDAGQNGAKKLADEIIKIFPNKKIRIIQWDKNLPKGFDIYDAFEKDNLASDFLDACANHSVIELKIESKKKKGLTMWKLNEFLKQEYDPTIPVIDSIVYRGQTAMIGGSEGCKKTFIALQMGLSIASGQKLFDYFETTQQNVMMVQFENENYDMAQRCEDMIGSFTDKVGNDDFLSRFWFSEVDAETDDFGNNWEVIEDTINENDFSEGVLIVDNLYTSTDLDLESNKDVKELMQTINRIRRQYKLTIILIAHCTKNSATVDKELKSIQIQGGATLCNNIANVTMVANSTLSGDLQVLKIVKGGRSAKNNLHLRPFKLHWSDDTCSFTKGAIIPNEALHFMPMKDNWEFEIIKWLSGMVEIQKNPYFDRAMFKRNLPEPYQGWDDRAVSRFITKMLDYGCFKKLGHNKYQLNESVVDELVKAK